MIVVDTSVLVAAFASWHESHAAAERTVVGSGQVGHCLVECYSVLTRLPAPHRVPPPVAADYLTRLARLPVVVPSSAVLTGLPTRLAAAGVGGGAAYDALVAVTAAEAGAELATLDARASTTYAAMGVRFRLVV